MPNRHKLALIAGVAINMVFGSLYAWSVFIDGLEADLGIMRAEVSFVFSVAIISFTAGNFVVPFLFGRVPGALMPLMAGGIGGAGLAFAGTAEGYLPVGIGYGLMFGFGCGFSYNAALQSALHAMPSNPGLANGIIISSFAGGSMIAAHLLSISVADVGVRATFWLLALIVVGVGVLAAALLAASGVRLPKAGPMKHGKADTPILGISYIGFFLGALAGVMSIGHAAAIVSHFGGTAAMAVLGVTLLGFGNAAGRLAAGWLCDHISVRSVAGMAHLAGVIGFIVVLANPTGSGAVVAMTLAGAAYGLNASVYPSAVSIFLGRAAYGRNFAILLTAWGAAGLIGPYLGGYLFDVTGDYRVPLELACVAVILALVNAMRLPRHRGAG